MKIKNTKTILTVKDLKQCYNTMRTILVLYFNGNMATSDFIDGMKYIYDIWFS